MGQALAAGAVAHSGWHMSVMLARANPVAQGMADETLSSQLPAIAPLERMATDMKRSARRAAERARGEVDMTGGFLANATASLMGRGRPLLRAFALAPGRRPGYVIHRTSSEPGSLTKTVTRLPRAAWVGPA
jgi:hypothetical protein